MRRRNGTSRSNSKRAVASFAASKNPISIFNPVTQGQKFDPHRHEAMTMVQSDAEPNTVVQVLQKVFSLDRNTATRIMLEVHTRGKGICGVFTYEIAETKVAQVTTYARDNQHPLMCTLEEL